MPQRLQNLLDWFENHAKTLDLFPEYARAVYSQWNDYLWGEIPVAPIVIWWMLGNPPMWVTIPAFFWAFLIAGYYVWRKEYVEAPLFRSWIPDMVGTPEGRLFVGMQIVNMGPPTSIQTWQGGFTRSDGSAVRFSDRYFVEGENVVAPDNIRGQNLRHDYGLLATGEIREGWLAFDVPQLDADAVALIMRTLTLTFTDCL
jgi:hypothetical protein